MSERPVRVKARFAFALVAAIAGCSRAGDHEIASHACACEDANAKLVDQALMAWLSKARTLHHLADLAEGDEPVGDAGSDSIDKAIAPLDKLVAGTVPPGKPPEVGEVLADTYARLAELRARRGDFERADKDVGAGLGFAPDKTYFRGHLLEVRGLIYDKLSQTLDKAGKGAEARVARQKAMQASVEAVRTQDEVIKSSLGDAGSTTRD